MRFLPLLLAVLLSGCISTSLQTHPNPEFADARYDKVAISTGMGEPYGSQLAQRLANRLADHGIAARSVNKLFPPYKDWSREEMRRKMLEQGIQAVLHVSVGRSAGSSQTIGYQTWTSGSTATTVPVRGYNRTTPSRAALIDLQSQENAWVASGRTVGRGGMYSGLDDAVADLADEYAQALAESGVIASH